MARTRSVSSPLVSAVTVNFNAGGLLCQSARAALASSVPLELLVVDNGSSDGSLDCLRRAVGADPRVKLFENGENLGFARASNIALREARGEFVLLLNPDCLVKPDTLATLVARLESAPRAGMAGPLVLNPDGTEQAGCRRREPTPSRAFVRAFWLDRLAMFRRHGLVQSGEPLGDAATEVDAISGACMLVRRAAIDDVGPLDEGYFLHCEDLDWCKRFRLAGWQVLFVPTAAATHDKGTSSRTRPVRALWHMHRGMIRYYRKFFGATYPAPLLGLVSAGVWLRFAVLAAAAVVTAPRRLLSR